jgi:hypothetical protein
MLKCEGRLVVQTLEANGFKQTERHDWNVMWTNNSGKAYIFEGLSEH